MTRVISKLRTALGRSRSTSTATDPLASTAPEDFLVEVSVPAEDGGEPVTVGFALSELREIDTLAELRERTAEKGAPLPVRSGNPRPNVNPGDHHQGINALLRDRGVPLDVERQKELRGTTIARFAPLRRGRGLTARAWGTAASSSGESLGEPQRPNEDQDEGLS